MSNNPLKQLETLGQSVWLNYIRRDLIHSGELQRLLDDDGLSGMTWDPAVFEQAITRGRNYTDDMQALAQGGEGAAQIYEAVRRQDTQIFADKFRMLYDDTNGRDGYVSIEISPYLAYSPSATVLEGRRLWNSLDRPNVLVRIPATPECLPAIQQLVSEGINVDITLIFGLPRYRQAARAYVSGIETRVRQGNPVSQVASVASFSVTPIDALVDSLLDRIIHKGDREADKAKLVRGHAAIATAKVAYHIFKETFSSPHFRRLAQCGARPQRLLWTDTAVRSQSHGDVKYIESLIGPMTVNAASSTTINAYRDHGHPRARVDHGTEHAKWLLKRLPGLGINIDHVTRQLEDEGVESAKQPFDSLMTALEQRFPPAKINL